MWVAGFNPDCFLTRIYLDVSAHAVYGIAFILIAVSVAPGHQKKVGFAMAGFIAACTIGLIYFDVIDGKFNEILEDLSPLLGAGIIVWRMWATQTWGMGIFQSGPSCSCSNTSGENR
jgi:hypothetical protein